MNSAMRFLVERMVVGPLAVNCYIVADPGTRDACIIDPGGDARRILAHIKKNGFLVRYVINTHGHADHIGANGQCGAPVYIHRLDKDSLADPARNLSWMMGCVIRSPKESRILEDGDVVILGSLELHILHVPGHTPGSIAVRVGSVVFTGDALFAGSIGRTDLQGGDEAALREAILKKLFTLPDDTVIYPGHGSSSTIGEEKRSNPYVGG